MRIAHYYPWLYLTSGIERTILEICRRSRHEHQIFTNHWDRENTYPGFSELDVRELAPVSVKRSLIPVLRASLQIAFGKLDLAGCDLLMVHCEGLGDLALIRNASLPAVCFCHTPLRAAFDDEYRKRVISKYKGLRRAAFEAGRLGFRFLDRRLWSRYSYSLFNSYETEERARSGGLLSGLKGKFDVLHPGIDWNAFQPSWTHQKYFLVPGRIMWTKNIELALDGFRKFLRHCPNAGFRLVIAGRVDAKSRTYLQDLKQQGADMLGVEFVENPTDERLWQLYRDCYSVLFPAFNEDWGLVPLEGNAFGKPVVAVDSGGPRESQLPGRTGLLTPAEPNAFCQAMILLAENEDLVQRLGKAGRQHAKSYDWSGFVDKIDELCERVVSTNEVAPLTTNFEERKKAWI